MIDRHPCSPLNRVAKPAPSLGRLRALLDAEAGR